MPIYTGTTNNDSLTGSVGADTLFGGLGNDWLNGGLGDDVFRFNLGTGNDTIADAGGTGDTLLLADPNGLYTGMDVYRSGNDLVFDFGAAAGKVTLQNQFALNSATRIEKFTTDDGWGPFVIQNGILGTAANDLIVGTAAAEAIAGGLGDDLIWGGAGNDTIRGDAGDNELHGGAGNDSLVAGSSGDDLYGGAGSDTLVGHIGWDEVYYEDQTAGVFANFSGEDQAYNNRLVAANRVLETATGAVDTLISIENFSGSAHGDYVVLGRTDAPLSFTLGKGNDTVVGGATSPNAWASLGYWDDPSGVIVNLSSRALAANLNGTTYFVGRNTARDAWGYTDTLILGNENLSINGSDSADYLRGRDDQIHDSFAGGQGNDTIDGGAGSSDHVTYDYSSEEGGSYGVVVNLSTAAVTATVGGAAVTVAAGRARDNWNGTDTLLNIENVTGSLLGDYILGSAGNNNYLDGRDGNDTINGGAGNDVIYGGAGNDSLTGGTGADIFVFDAAPNAATNVDRVLDFSALDDTIHLENGVMAGLGVSGVMLSANAFYAAAGAARAMDQYDRVIYNTTTGDLYYDADGTGAAAAVRIGVISRATSAPLSHLDFYVA